MHHQIAEVECFTEAFEAYRKGRFSESLTRFEAYNQLRQRNGMNREEDKVAVLFTTACKVYLSSGEAMHSRWNGLRPGAEND